MKIGILVLSIGSFGAKGFYNLQEIGLAKALVSFCDEVKVYKLVANTAERQTQDIEGTRNASLDLIPSKQIGSNGIPDMRCIDKNLDALVCFSDTQIMFPKVYRWAEKNKIKLIPYIGVVESHSTNKVKQYVMNCLFSRNVAVYKKCRCCVKTPAVQEKLASLGVTNTIVTTVGLDLDLLKKDYESFSSIELKKKYGYHESDKVLLFIGRMIDEKQPVRMIDIMADIRKKDAAYKLLMVGTGELKSTVEARIKELDLQDSVQMVERIPNSDIWELYRLADSFVNLNQQEIFGMAILEAMYYGCKVVAWKAPGPNLIIENGKSGWLAGSDSGVIEKIMDTAEVGTEAHRRVLAEFTWESSAKKMRSVIIKKEA